jgi:hypothetical protein
MIFWYRLSCLKILKENISCQKDNGKQSGTERYSKDAIVKEFGKILYHLCLSEVVHSLFKSILENVA